jgi:hypothetical protein
MICRTLTVATLIAVCYFCGALAATTIGDLTIAITAGGGGSPLTVDSQESGGIAHRSGTSPLTWTFNNAAGTTLFVAVTANAISGSGPPTIGTPTYNGVAMTAIPNSLATITWGGYPAVTEWFYLDAPATGSHAVSAPVTFPTPNSYTSVIGAAISFIGAATPTPYANAIASATQGTNGAASPYTLQVTGTTNGDYVLSAVTNGDNISGANSPTTESALLNNSGDDTADTFGIGYQMTAGGTVTASWSGNSPDAWTLSAFEVVAASPSQPPPPSPLTVTFSPASPTVLCAAAPGTTVSTIGTSGGDGNSITLSISGDTTDFDLSGTNIVVGPNGITTPDCGQVDIVTVTGTQQ